MLSNGFLLDLASPFCMIQFKANIPAPQFFLLSRRWKMRAFPFFIGKRGNGARCNSLRPNLRLRFRRMVKPNHLTRTRWTNSPTLKNENLPGIQTDGPFRSWDV